MIPKNEGYNIIIANFNNQMFIYTNEFRLIWAVKVDEVPIKISICKSPTLKGALALLGEDGSISLAYLGT